VLESGLLIVWYGLHSLRGAAGPLLGRALDSIRWADSAKGASIHLYLLFFPVRSALCSHRLISANPNVCPASDAADERIR
jgi:hypothetical protein